ncbi:MAG: MarR family transcriptional regulator [Anaerolineae bacterium]|nr:MarR family transcriptional regulator [Anaerolineae bacterium]
MGKIRILIQPEDLLQMRFAYSPLIELVSSYRLLHHIKYQPHYQRWIDAAKQALYGLDFPYLHALTTARSYIPDFLTPTPTRTNLTLEDELLALLEVPDAVIHRNVEYLILIDGDSEIRQQYLTYTREVLLCLIDELRLYWNRALAAHWPRMMAVLEGDVLYRARQLALEGPEKLLANLNPALGFEEMALVKKVSAKEIERIRQIGTCYPATHERIESNDAPVNEYVDYRLPGTGLQLVPGLFIADHFSWQFAPEWQPMLLYGPRGVGLWNQRSEQPNESLEIALGAGRARVLQMLVMPSNTGEIARKLHISAGAVSQHLGRLNDAGLVEPHRSGKRVFYHLTRRGKDLINLFERSY